jgi:hypothetical protein
VADDARTLSPRAQEILRRADEQVASLRRSRALAGAMADAPDAAAPAPVELDGPPDPQRLMDRVQAGIDASRAHLDALAEALEALAGELGVEVDVTPVAGEPVLPAALASHAHLPGELLGDPQEDAESHEAVVERPSGAAQDAARLVAIEMAVAGDTRELVGRRLSEEFGMANPKEILDDVFGPGSGSSTRMR